MAGWKARDGSEEAADGTGSSRDEGDDGRASLVVRAGNRLASRYDVLHQIRVSGCWTVCAARDVANGARMVLLSVFDRDGLDPSTLGEVERGLAWARDLVHPHVVPVVDHGSADGLVWFVTRRDLGRPLGAVLSADGRRSSREVLRLARQLCSCLVLLHRGGRCHGALCPSNILVDAKDRARIANLGVDGPVLHSLLRRGRDAGEAGEYAAPEVMAGEPPSALADQYSAARILLECLHEDEREDVPEALMRALSPEPGERHPDITAFLNALVNAWGVVTPGATAKEPVRPPVVLVPAPLDDDEMEEGDEPAQQRGGGTFTRGAVTLATAGGLVGAFLVGQNAFADVDGSRTGIFRNDTTPRPAVERTGASAVLVYGSTPTRRQSRTQESAPPAADPERPEPARPTPAGGERGADPVARPESVQRQRTSRPVTPPRAETATPERRFGRLFVNAYPWGTVYVNGRRIGNTPIVDFPVEAGQHEVRVERDGFEPWEEEVEVEPGGQLRRTGIVLEKRSGG